MRNQKKYQFELKTINPIINKNNLPKEILQFDDEITSLSMINHCIPSIKQSKKAITKLDKYLLINKNFILIKQIFHIINRTFNKIICKTNKRLFIKSPIIVYYGSDGCGKSTLVSRTYEVFSSLIPARKVHLGKPFSGFYIFNNLYARQSNKDNLTKI